MSQIEHEIRAALPRTWHPFFGRFGRLTSIQRQAALPIVGGEAVMVVAPTASGKTEAVVAPLLERALERGASSGRAASIEGEVRVLVISPTRALCGDLARRLLTPVRRCGLRLGVKSGDSPLPPGRSWPEVLVTTPESLDSLLCRRPASLRAVVGVMLDELHLLAAGPRGDQLACLLARLERVAEGGVQRCGASATVARAGEVARRFLGGDARVLEAGAGDGPQRRIEAELVDAATMEEAVEVVASLASAQARQKLMVFANSRGQVEAMASALGRLPRLTGRVFAHHGSLATGERRRVERAFQGAPSGVCVSTVTLEIGIDVGDVSRVVLLAPPPGVASLLQRVGRGNRRGHITRVTCLCGGDFERLRFEHLLECAARGEIFDEPMPLRPAVVAQQAISLLYQNPARWISAHALCERLPPGGGFDREGCEELLGGMVEAGWLRGCAGGRFVPDERAAQAFETGRLHVNFTTERALEVIDGLTGRVVGGIVPGRGGLARAARGGALSLGGRARRVSRVTGGRVMLGDGEVDEGQDEVGFLGREAPRCALALAQSLARRLGVPEGVVVVEPPTEDAPARLGHFWGSVWGRLLEATLHGEPGGPGRPFFVPCRGGAPPPGPLFGPGLLARAEAALEADLEGMARLLEPGAMVDAVPRALLRRWVRQAVDLEGFVKVASRAVVVSAPGMQASGGEPCGHLRSATTPMC